MTPAPIGVVVLISGRGSNLQSILDRARAGDIGAEVRAVVSNVATAGGLEHARESGVATRVVDHRSFADRDAFDRALADGIDSFQPDLVVLAGFMRVLTPAFVERFAGRLINIHPSLLPLFPGLDTHRRAIDAGATEHGASVHFVSSELDGGPVIIQARVPVLADDDPEQLAARVLEQEHRILPQAIQWFAQGRLAVRDGRVWIDGQPALG